MTQVIPVVEDSSKVSFKIVIIATLLTLSTKAGVPLYVLEDRLFRVANWEDQTKEDLASKFCKRREKIAIFSPLKTEDELSLENH